MRSMSVRMAFLVALALGVAVASVFIGPVPIGPIEALRALRAGSPSVEVDIVLRQRVPRILLGLLTGGTLAVAGASFQSLLGNPLATPYTLGLAGGSSVGAVLALLFPATVGAHGQVLPSLLCTMATAGIVYALGSRRGGLRGEPLILAGVTVGFVCSALVLFARYLASPQSVVMMDRWLMGGLEQVGFSQVRRILPAVGAGVAVLGACHRELDQVSFGSAMAAGRGVPVEALRATVYLAATLACGAVVSVAGPIAFVGLIVPHVLRRLVGFSHGRLLPACWWGGAAFLVTCDSLARTLLAPAELPVGIITAGIGGPFFLAILLRGGRSTWVRS